MTSDGERYYIGVRSSDKMPWEDEYLGSFRDKTFKPKHKNILSYHETREDAKNTEIYWHNLFDVAKNPLFANLAKATSTGFDRSGIPAANKGKKLSQGARKKLSDARKGRKLSQSTKDKIGKANSISQRGKKMSAETKTKISMAVSGDNNPFAGKTHSQAAKNKISRANKGRLKGIKNPNADTTIYLFQKESLIENCTRYEMMEKYNLPGSFVQICNGNRRTYKGWICLCPIGH